MPRDVSDDAKTLLFIIAYAGSDAGTAALEAFLSDVANLRKVAEEARRVVDARIPAVTTSEWKHSRISDSITDRLAEALRALEAT